MLTAFRILVAVNLIKYGAENVHQNSTSLHHSLHTLLRERYQEVLKSIFPKISGYEMPKARQNLYRQYIAYNCLIA